MQGVYFQAYQEYLFNLEWRTQSRLAGRFFLLCNGGALGPTSTMAEIIAQELNGSGYARQPCSPGAGGASSGRWVGTAEPEWTLTAATVWSDLVLIIGGTNARGNTQGTPCLLAKLDTPETIVANSPRKIEVSLGNVNVGGL
jgi:hypothetical protein